MRTASIAAALLVLSPVSTAAQVYYSPYSQGHAGQGSSWRGYGRYDFNGQADRPGDYRCDRYWDANRDDCGEPWRDQRSHGYRRSGHGYGYGGYGARPTYGYGYGYNYSYGYGSGAGVYPGAYGRPDLVYPGGGAAHGYAYAGGGRDPARVAWCRRAYRSYDPGSGYYRAYSGRLVFCG